MMKSDEIATIVAPDESILVVDGARLRWNANYEPPVLEHLQTELHYKGPELVDKVERWVPVPTVDRGLSNDIDNLRNTLNLFREFVIKNTTQWKMGAGVHHHPMWAMVAEALGEVPDIRSGPEWMFIQPTNRKTLGELEKAAVKDDSS